MTWSYPTITAQIAPKDTLNDYVLPTSPCHHWYECILSSLLSIRAAELTLLHSFTRTLLPTRSLTNLPPGANFTPTIHTDTYADISPSTKSDLTGRAVFISGASRGIGRATALSYARAGAAQIAVAAPNGLDNIEQEILAAASSMKREPPQTLVLELNVLDLASVKAAAQKTEHCFGKLDILINNAGYLEKGIPIAESDPDDYWKTWEINYRGLYWMTRAFLPLLLRSGDLRTIVNLSSMGALSLRPGGSAYQTSKFAILKFTEFVMTEYAEQGVLCYAVHPGGVMTELASNMPTETHSGMLFRICVAWTRRG